MIGLMNINAERPLVIHSYDQLCEVVKAVLSDAGVLPQQEQPPAVPKQVEYNGEQISKLLCEKGYHAKSYKGYKRVLDEYEIAGIKRGQEMWYPAELVDKIPSRKA